MAIKHRRWCTHKWVYSDADCETLLIDMPEACIFFLGVRVQGTTGMLIPKCLYVEISRFLGEFHVVMAIDTLDSVE